MQVLSREEIEPEVTGDLKLVDCETNAFTEISMSGSLLKRYKENMNGFRESLRRYCVARDIGHAFTASDGPVDRVVLEGLRRGGLLR